MKRRKNRIVNRSVEDIAVDIAAYGIMGILAVITLFPLLNVAAISFSSYKAYLDHPLMVIPYDLDLSTYVKLFNSRLLWTSYGNTVFIAAVGTAINVLLSVMTAYPLAKKKVRGSNIIMFLIVFTMMFNGGIIPTYMVVKNLGLIDSLWSLILPMAISTYNFVIIKTFIESIPDSIEESATIDGAGHFTILFKLVFPLSKPTIATITMFYAVSNWNRVFDAIMYINSKSKWPLSLLLREIITESTNFIDSMDPAALENVFPKNIQCATIMIAVLPIMAVYPFVQKYFIQGIMLGAVKG